MDLRRAISAAYYALFHELTGDAADLSAQTGRVRDRLRRTYSHKSMDDAAKRMEGGKIAAVVDDLISPTASLRSVAADFRRLQQQRHLADYDLAKRFRKSEAVAAVARAERALNIWEQIRRTEEATVFLGSLGMYGAWKKEPR